MKPLFTHAELRQMDLSAKQGTWVGLIKLADIPAFAAWLSERGWICQSPDCGEVLRIHKDGLTRYVSYNGKRTSCGRGMMALWYTFLCFGKEDCYE